MGIVLESSAPGRAISKFWQRIAESRGVPRDNPKTCLTPSELAEYEALSKEFNAQHHDCWNRILERESFLYE
jgi:hypothetical protein